MKPSARVVPLLLAAVLAGGLSGCQDNIPKSATMKDFCSAGEKFSASNTFSEGERSAKRLGDVGTPKDIPQRARDGFVQLVNRVLDAKDGPDFIKRSKKLNADERKNLRALNDYIQKTCKS
jgi:hypothetical protein